MGNKKLSIIIICIIVLLVGFVIYKFISSASSLFEAASISTDNGNIELYIGDSKQLTVTIKPEKKNNEITWKSNDPSIAIVDNNGLVTGISMGATTINVQSGTLELDIFVVVKRPFVPTPEPTIMPTLSPTPEPTPTPIPQYEIKLYGVDKNIMLVKKEGEKIGSLPNQTKDKHVFLGWYTDKVAGTKVDENTIVTKNMDLYPHWEEITYVITRDAPIPTAFTPTTYNYDSNSLKYKVYKDSTGHYFALVWVKDSAKQLHSALPMKNDGNTNFHKVKVDANVNNEIVKYGYTSKGIIAINGSFSWSTDPGIRVIINRGEIVRSLNKDNGPRYSSLGIRSNGELKGYDTGVNLQANMVADGVLNNWAVVGYTTTNWSGHIANEKADAARTQICQIDKNNFVLANFLSSRPITYPMGWKIMHDYFPNCTFAVNLDGGGSTRMYYKTNTMTKVAKIYESYDTDRKNVDALYFVEQ